MIETQPVISRTTEPRSLDRFMMASVLALSLIVVASVVSIGFDINRLSVISRLLSDASSRDLSGFSADLTAAHTSDNQTAAIGVVEIVAWVISTVCFIAWFHRAYRNLLHLGAASLRYRSGWAIGAWFVPILNVWRPKQIANDIWRGSDPSHPREQPSWSEQVSPLLWFWWAAWLLAGVLGRVSAQQWNNGASVHALRSVTRLDIAAECVSVLAAGLAIAVVYTLTKRESERARANQVLADFAEAG